MQSYKGFRVLILIEANFFGRMSNNQYHLIRSEKSPEYKPVALVPTGKLPLFKQSPNFASRLLLLAITYNNIRIA